MIKLAFFAIGMEIAKISKIASSLRTSFSLEQDIITEVDIQSKEAFQQAISKIVRMMVENDFERFLSIMYRMDISELKLKKTFDASNSEDVYLKIAELIISREEEKVFWRKNYEL